jgi:hypothetical protein
MSPQPHSTEQQQQMASAPSPAMTTKKKNKNRRCGKGKKKRLSRRISESRRQQSSLRLANAATPTLLALPPVLSPLDGALYIAYREKTSLQSAHDVCVRRFGFACSHNNSKYTNLEEHLWTTAYKDLNGSMPSNLKVHNLCQDPLGISPQLLQVLGLGLGFCVSLCRNPAENPMNLARLRHDIRT